MNVLNEALRADFGVELSDNFRKCACYYPKIDHVEYLTDDVVAIADRIDPFLTVLWNEDFSDYVGFKLKGFHAWYVRRNKDTHTEEDFNLLVEALEYYVTQIGNSMFPENPARKAAYNNVISFIKRDKIGIPAQDMKKLKAA